MADHNQKIFCCLGCLVGFVALWDVILMIVNGMALNLGQNETIACAAGDTLAQRWILISSQTSLALLTIDLVLLFATWYWMTRESSLMVVAATVKQILAFIMILFSLGMAIMGTVAIARIYPLCAADSWVTYVMLQLVIFQWLSPAVSFCGARQ